MGWFDDVMRDVVWKAIRDAANAVGAWTETEAESFLQGLTPGQKLSDSPFVGVVAVNDNFVTVLVRGRESIGAFSPFLRLEAQVSKDVNITSSGPLSDVNIIDLAGELLIEKKDVAKGALALGYVDGAWAGRGMIKILPGGGFGLDIFLGGLDERGLMLGMDLDLPAPIPLGSTGLGLKGIGGDFAYNFVPRLESPPGTDILDPTAKDYVAWAKNHEIDRWRPGPLDETAVGVAIRADIGTLADNLKAFALEPIGLSILTPGPIFLLGGAGRLVRSNSMKVEGYLVVDVPSQSLALGLDADLRIPPTDKMLVEGKGSLNAFFSFADPASWYLRLGSQPSPVKIKFIEDSSWWTAMGYFGIDNTKIGLGAGVEIGNTWEPWILVITAKASFNADAIVGWNPFQIQAGVRLSGELGIKVWKIGVAIRAYAAATVALPDPTQLKFEVGYTIDLPWPIPDIDGTADLVLGDDPTAPTLAAPLLAGTSSSPMRVAALNTITGRQWELATSGDLTVTWPDIELIIPFSRRVTDATGKVIGDTVPSEDAGGYTVTHRLTELELVDLVNNDPVPDMKAVWANAPGGTTARLHVLARDPYAWLLPHDGASGTATASAQTQIEQRFGFGPPRTFAAPRRFGQVVVDPLPPAELLTDFQPHLDTRVLRTGRFQLAFREPDGSAVEVDTVSLLVIVHSDIHIKLAVDDVEEFEFHSLRHIFADLYLGEITFKFAGARSTFDVDPADAMLVYGVRYRIARPAYVSDGTTTVLAPGRYRLTISGETSAEKPSGTYPDASPVTWALVQDFEVDHPDSTRPYTVAAAPGDARNFGAEQDAWHPAESGPGFAGYQQYAPYVRTRVDYLNEIFSALELWIRSDDGLGQSVQSLPPAPNPAGETSALPASSAWVSAGGGVIEPDDEIVGTTALPSTPGPATVEVAVLKPDGERRSLDTWPCVISRFAHFRAHVAWSGPSITRSYRADGPREWTACPVPGSVRRALTPYERIARKEHRIGHTTPAIEAVFNAHLLDVVAGFDLDAEPYPQELTTPPAGWSLPTTLTSLLGPLGRDSGHRFVQIALRSGARFGIAGSRLDGLTDVVVATTVEAITDDHDRPLALWLRTPEPLDWRRVTVRLRIRHVNQGDHACPIGFAHRNPLDLDMQVMPSPDGSSAFLVASFAGVPTRLPRGVYALTLTFASEVAELVRLRPLSAVGATPETVTLTFVHPGGQDWPLPSTGLVIPAGFLEWLSQQEKIDLHELFEQWRPPLPFPGPDPDPIQPVEIDREIHTGGGA